jgi:hypothetical protein
VTRGRRYDGGNPAKSVERFDPSTDTAAMLPDG